MIVEAPVTVREVLHLLLAADSYPRLGNHDWREADLLEAEALQKAATAEPRADDPPEFARWFEMLLTPGHSKAGREAVYFALHDFFDEGGGRASYHAFSLAKYTNVDDRATRRVGRV
jgi:hypothetical protein